MLDSINCQPVKQPCDDDAMHPYFAILTPYTYRLLSEQFRSSANTVVADTGIVNSHEGQLVVGNEACCCRFYNTLRLPCRHILSLRQDKGLPVYDEALVPKRWKRSTWRQASIVHGRDTATATVSIMQSRTQVATVLSAARSISRNQQWQMK